MLTSRSAERAHKRSRTRGPQRRRYSWPLLRLEECEPRLLPAIPPSIFLTPAVLSTLRQEASQNTPQWQAFKARLDQNLPQVLSEGAYQGDWLSWISDYALGYQVLQASDPATASAYADKALGIMKSAIHDYQKGGWIDRQYLTRGDGATRTFTLPNSDLIPSSLEVFTAPVSTVTVTHSAANGQDAVDWYDQFIKVSNAPDGNPDYAQGTDWQRNGNYAENMIDWAPGGAEPAVGATYYVTVSSPSSASVASYTLNGNQITLATAPTAGEAIFVSYVYGTHASDGSSLAYQQTGLGDGGLNSVMADSGYTYRYLGKHVAMGLDWLDGYVGLTPALESQVENTLAAWDNYFAANGYYANSPASNYGAGGYVSRVLTGLALANRAGGGPQLLADALNYRQTYVVPLLTSPTTSDYGGFWSEGWNYGPLAVQNILLAGLALQDAGSISSAAAEQQWASQVTQHLISAQATSSTVYDGGDWYAYPAPFPGKSLFYVLSAVDTNPTTQAYDNYIIQNYASPQTSNFADLLFRNPSASASFWSSMPLQYLAQGTGLMTARSDWGTNPTWVSLQMGNLLQADHQTYTPGTLQIQRGADDLLVNASEVVEAAWPHAPYGNSVIVDDNGAGTQVYRFSPGYWYGTPGVVINAYEGTSDHAYLYGDYHAAYSLPSAPGAGGTTSELTRQMVYLRPGYILVYDRVTTVAANDPKQLHWHFLNMPTVNGNSFVATAGSSKLFGATFSTDPLGTTASMESVNGSPMTLIVTQNTDTSASVRYVTAFQVASATTSAMVPTQQILTADRRMEGAQIADQLVLFGRNGDVDLSTPVTFNVNSSTTLADMLTNLHAGQTYTVLVDGTPLATLTASAAGTITFSTPAGSHSVQVGTGGAPVAQATHYAVTGPATATVGTPASITVTALDASNNVVPGYTGTVHFTSTDNTATLPSNYTFTSADAGSHTFTVTFGQTGSQTVNAADTATPSITGSATVSVSATMVARIALTAPTAATAGAAFSLTVTALDASGNVVPGYSGTVHFTSSDAGAALPAVYTFTSADAGTHTFSATVVHAGNQSIGITDGTRSSSVTVAVIPAGASHLTFSAPPTAIAGGPFHVTLTAYDAFGNLATGYVGTVHFASSDAGATLPSDYSFTNADAGTHTFSSVMLIHAGQQTISVSDTVAGMNQSATIVVAPAAAARFQLAAPTTTVTGTPFSMQLTAVDSYGNRATAYAGTVRFSSTDATAVLPPLYTFTSLNAGQASFQVVLNKLGTATVTATDIQSASLTGSASVQVLRKRRNAQPIVPSNQSTLMNVPLVFSARTGNALNIDANGDTAPFQVTLTAAGGTLALARTIGLSLIAGNPTSTGSLTFQATAETLNAALDGLTFRPMTGFTGAAHVQITLSDPASPDVAIASTIVTVAVVAPLGNATTLQEVHSGGASVLFSVAQDHSLYRYEAATGWTKLGSFIRSVSATADTAGRVVLFAVTIDGALFRYEAVAGWRLVGAPGTIGNVRVSTDAAGWAAAWVRTADGGLTEYRDASGWLAKPVGGSGSILAMAPAAGDRVMVVTADHSLYQFTLAQGWTPLTSPGFANAVSVADDGNGLTVYALTPDGSLFSHRDASGWVKLGDGVRAMSAASDSNGTHVYAITATGDLWKWQGTSLSHVDLPGSAIADLTAGAADRLFAIASDGSLQEHDDTYGWFALTSPAFARV